MTQTIQAIDSHTAGEPTRIVYAGGPELGGGTVAERLRVFREKYDHYRSAIVNEPRGSDVIVGALIVEPADSTCAAGVIFFNNVGFLGMCGHGTIGLIVTLARLGRIRPGEHRIETPVGIITATLHERGEVSIRNIASHRLQKDVCVSVDGLGEITGDVAWGGNWFFLVNDHGQTLELSNVESLTDVAWRIRRALVRNHITGEGGAEIDHVELFGLPRDPKNQSRNFVLCPGKAYDRSPCGTGTSAKLACLYADGKLLPGEIWRQESILGGVFEGSVEIVDGQIIPTIKGTAHVTAETALILQENDPLKWGIR
jgi:4-hydroxyproline epimerase